MNSSVDAVIPEEPSAEIEALCILEPRFHPLAKRHHPFPLPSRPFSFDLFAGSIVGQSISTKAASSVMKRLRSEIAEGGKLTASLIQSYDAPTLKSLGLSRAKAECLLELADYWATERLTPQKVQSWSNQEFYERFGSIRGIGPWTVNMVLIFGLRRVDIFPEGDLGIRVGIQMFLDLPERPSQKQCRDLALPWAPYRTLATVYLWQLVMEKSKSGLDDDSTWWSEAN